MDAWEAPTGLQFTLRLGTSSRAHEVDEAIARGDLSGVSVGFSVARDEWSVRGKVEHRRVLEGKRLLEFSFVPFPAYADTSVSVGGGGSRTAQTALDRRLRDLDRIMAVEAARMPASGPRAATVARRGLVVPGGIERRTFALVVG